jgi:ApeA N-terminal domain 1
VSINEEVRFEMTADEPQPLSVFRRRVGACQDLVSIALLTRCNVQVLRVCPPSDGKRRVVAEYHAVPVFRDPSGQWVDHLFRFQDIAPKAREVFTAWFENAERLSAVRSLYLSAAYGKSFLEIKLLALAQAAEAFHRRFSEGKDCYMQQLVYERDVFAPMEKGIPAVVNESHRQSLRGRLRFGNEYSFRKRLTLLFEEHAAAIKAAIPNPMSWIEPLVNYRNTLTHHPVAESEQTTNTTELVQCNYVLTILLELCFLKAMGMDAAQIEGLAKDCGRYSQIRERFFKHPATSSFEALEVGYELTITSVDSLTREEIATCIDVVVEGAAVPQRAAQTGVAQAAKLAVVRCKGEIVGVGVIKGPNVQHARTVAKEHKYAFPDTTPELGYASVRKAHRNKHLSSRIFEELLSGSDESLYAVTSEPKMKHLLRKHGFVERGVPTKGRRGDRLSLWLKLPS